MPRILQKEEKLLRETAKPVPLDDIGSARIRAILSDMQKAMHAEEDAVAIAAPQIGVSLRIFVVSGEALAHADTKKRENGTPQGGKATESPDLVFINPEITKRSKKTNILQEGCLSVRWLYGDVRRAEKITVKAYDENGKPFTRGASGLLAQIFQHETEHLDGVLFIDKAKNIEELPPEKVQKLKRGAARRASDDSAHS